MNVRNRFATVLTAAVLAGSLVGGVQAQATDTAAVTINPGTLTASIVAGDFGSADYSFADQDVTSNGLVLTITNKTGSPAGWTVTTTATDYVGQARNGESIPFDETTTTGTEELTRVVGQEVTGMSEAVSLASGGTAEPIITVEAPAGSGQGQYTLTLSQLTLNVPGGTLAQTYTSTLTVNVPSAP
jgi:hypothetical protein